MTVAKNTLSEIPNWEEMACFGCGEKNTHGLKMKFHTDGKRLYSFVHVPLSMTGWGSKVHGGIISTILDEIMGWTVIHLYKKLGVTKTMTVDFLKPISAGEELTVIGSVHKKPGQRSAVITGELYNASEILCARSIGEFSIIDAKLAVRLGLVEKEYMASFGKVLGF